MARITSREDLAQALRDLRVHRGLAQKEVGAAVDVGQSAVSNWEKGSDPPTLDNLLGVLARLGAELRIETREERELAELTSRLAPDEVQDLTETLAGLGQGGGRRDKVRMLLGYAASEARKAD